MHNNIIQIIMKVLFFIITVQCKLQNTYVILRILPFGGSLQLHTRRMIKIHVRSFMNENEQLNS